MPEYVSLQFFNGFVNGIATLDVSVGNAMLMHVMILGFWKRFKFRVTHVTVHITVIGNGSININLCYIRFLCNFFQLL